MTEKRSQRNIFDSHFGERAVEHSDPLRAAPEMVAAKMVENRFRATGLTQVDTLAWPSGSWEVLLRGTVGVYDEDTVYYRVTYSPQSHEVVIEKFKCSSRVRVGGEQAMTIMSRGH